MLLASFLPMLLIAGAFAALNRVDPDCGTTFSWVTRALGPWTGWIGGWAIAMTGVLVLGLAGRGRRAVHAPGRRAGRLGRVHARSSWRLSVAARSCVMAADLRPGHRALRAAAERADRGPDRGAGRSSPSWRWRGARAATARSAVLTPEWNWLDPFGAGGAALTGGLLLGVFAYWGWESAVNLTEETTRLRGGRPAGPGSGRPSCCW